MSNFNQKPNVGNATRFAKSPMSNVEFSRMVATPTWLLSMNAGDIVPVYYSEVLPHSTFSIDTDFVLRQTTLLRPVMGEMQIDLYAFFVPNRIINESWKNVQGENTSGFWSAPEVDLAPLYSNPSLAPVQVPVGSVADFYGFPTQLPMRGEVLSQCNDLKFRGYLEIYNQYFRDQNYQPPIPYSKLNVYNGFFEPVGSAIALNGARNGTSRVTQLYASDVADGSYADGALVKAIYGEGGKANSSSTLSGRLTSWSALDKPLKANKLHDMFTSALPSPQKGAEVYFTAGGLAPVVAGNEMHEIDLTPGTIGPRLNNLLRFKFNTDDGGNKILTTTQGASSYPYLSGQANGEAPTLANAVTASNMVADLSQATGVSINDLRTAIATQQVYETLARGGSRYTSVLRNFFELDTESPFPDVPVQLGHIRRGLDLYQVAQTSATSEDSPQATLSAYGYTNKGGHLFQRTFIEHGYVHIFAVVRQRNLYSTYFAQDNFRRSTLDFYLPQFANIGEQPLKLAHLNPFHQLAMENAIGYQEAWSEYRYEPDRVHGQLRSGVEQSLDVWTYADNFEPSFTVITGDWLKSNAEEVMNRSLAVTSDIAPQFKAMFVYRVDKQLPMPTYSIPGLDNV